MSIAYHDALKKRLELVLHTKAMELALEPGATFEEDRLRQGVCQGIKLAIEESEILETAILKG